MPNSFINDITIDSNGDKWICSLDGVSKFDNTIWINITLSAEIPSNQYINSISSDGEDIWMSAVNNLNTEGSGALFFQNNQWDFYDSLNTPMYKNVVSLIELDSDNNKWFSIITGQILKYDNQNWIAYDYLHTPEYGYAISDFEFFDDTVWVSTGGAGVWKFFDSPSSDMINISTMNSELPSDNVLCMSKEDSKIWFGTWNGLAMFDKVDNEWVVFNTSNSDLPKNSISSIAIDGNGTKWIGTYGGGLVKLENNTMTIFNTNNSELPNNTVRTIIIDENQNKWIGTNDGLAVFNESGVILPINNIDNRGDIPTIFPNPSTGLYTITANKIKNIQIIDIAGKVILNREIDLSNSAQVDMNKQKEGVYFLTITTQETVETMKIILE